MSDEATSQPGQSRPEVPRDATGNERTFGSGGPGNPSSANRSEDGLDPMLERPETGLERRAPRWEPPRTRRPNEWWPGGGAWVLGALLLILGLILLLQNMGLTIVHNWWALFILLPAFGALGTAWSMYRSSGRLNTAARGSLITGLIMSAVALAFLLNLDLSLVWPLALVLVGVGALLNARLR